LVGVGRRWLVEADKDADKFRSPFDLRFELAQNLVAAA
jgi:hypothetical protein